MAGGIGTRALLGAAAAMAMTAGAAGAVPFRIDLDRISTVPTSPEEEQPTFSGGGTLSMDGAGLAVEALALRVETLGTFTPGLPDPPFFGEPVPTVYEFAFGPEDVASVSGLDGGAVAGDLDGVSIAFDSVANQGGPGSVVLDGFGIDFGAGTAGAFCFSADEGAGFSECVRGGGSSTGIEAAAAAAVIPLPASLPLALAGLGALGLGRLGARRGA